MHYKKNRQKNLATDFLHACVMYTGGDGPKRALLQQMVSSEGLEGRVTLAGAIPHERARDFMVGVTITNLAVMV